MIEVKKFSIMRPALTSDSPGWCSVARGCSSSRDFPPRLPDDGLLGLGCSIRWPSTSQREGVRIALWSCSCSVLYQQASRRAVFILTQRRVLIPRGWISPKAMSRYTFIAGVALGLAIHMKIYPVIYTLAIALHISGTHCKHPCSILRQLLSGQSFIFLTVRTERLVSFYSRFTPCATQTTAACFSIVSIWCWQTYGDEFLDVRTKRVAVGSLKRSQPNVHLCARPRTQNAILYHLTRTDHRHNYSMHFLSVYLMWEVCVPPRDSVPTRCVYHHEAAHRAPVPTTTGTRDPPLAHASRLIGGQLVRACSRPATLHLRADLPLCRGQ